MDCQNARKTLVKIYASIFGVDVFQQKEKMKMMLDLLKELKCVQIAHSNLLLIICAAVISSV